MKKVETVGEIQPQRNLSKLVAKSMKRTPTPPPKAQRKHKGNNKEQRYIKPTFPNIKTWGLFGAYLGLINKNNPQKLQATTKT